MFKLDFIKWNMTRWTCSLLSQTKRVKNKRIKLIASYITTAHGWFVCFTKKNTSSSCHIYFTLGFCHVEWSSKETWKSECSAITHHSYCEIKCHKPLQDFWYHDIKPSLFWTYYKFNCKSMRIILICTNKINFKLVTM